ncbi:16S rRNA (guanine(527)-N(7))-methyltransferase RsmG [bacterium]|nr:16S rRNA (guanine(527)-N(7))-methyltransferase RsmG [bacterium]
MPKNLNITLDDNKRKLFEKYSQLFIQKNSQLNLISKKDEKFLFEKHILDSLAISLVLNPKSGENILDIGTGGGFPSVPLAIFYDGVKVYGIDSIRKKIKAVEELKQKLGLENLTLICDRVEKFDKKFDYVVSRAVASLDKILEYAIPHVKKGGYFIAYKSRKVEDEIKAAQSVIKKFHLAPPEIVSYTLPLEEVFERNLVVFRV